MSKFGLLALFLLLMLHWLNQPFEIDHNDPLIKKYRPSLYKTNPKLNGDTTSLDLPSPIQTTTEKQATALYLPKAMKLVQYNN